MEKKLQKTYECSRKYKNTKDNIIVYKMLQQELLKTVW